MTTTLCSKTRQKQIEADLYFQRTLKKKGLAFRSIGTSNYYILDGKISLASFARYFNYG